MTKDTNKENTLKVIRYIQETVGGLKELSEGCQFTFKPQETIYKLPVFAGKVAKIVYGNRWEWESLRFEFIDEKINHRQYFDDNKSIGDKSWRIETEGLKLIDAIPEGYYDSYESRAEHFLEIIGHEPQLNHLLLAIPNMQLSHGKIGTIITVYPSGSIFPYDLTKTVQENLESNPELTNYLINLFGL